MPIWQSNRCQASGGSHRCGDGCAAIAGNCGPKGVDVERRIASPFAHRKGPFKQFSTSRYNPWMHHTKGAASVPPCPLHIRASKPSDPQRIASDPSPFAKAHPQGMCSKVGCSLRHVAGTLLLGKDMGVTPRPLRLPEGDIARALKGWQEATSTRRVLFLGAHQPLHVR